MRIDKVPLSFSFSFFSHFELVPLKCDLIRVQSATYDWRKYCFLWNYLQGTWLLFQMKIIINRFSNKFSPMALNFLSFQCNLHILMCLHSDRRWIVRKSKQIWFCAIHFVCVNWFKEIEQFTLTINLSLV